MVKVPLARLCRYQVLPFALLFTLLMYMNQLSLVPLNDLEFKKGLLATLRSQESRFILEEPPLYLSDLPNETICEFVELGCFQAIPGNVQQQNGVMTRNWCALHCLQRKYSFAGLSNGDTCTCYKSSIRNGRLTSSACDARCRGNKEEICGAGRGKSTLLFQKGTCVDTEKVTDEFLESRYKGCFRLPSRDSSFRAFQMTSRGHCFVTCERLRHPVAAYGQDGMCLCGQMTDRFNLTHQTGSCGDLGDSVQLYRTLVEDKRCGDVGFLPVDSSRKKTLLVSYPGSGNTWVRFLLEKSSGIYTSSVYKDYSLFVKGYLGEMTQDGIVFVKEHLFSGVMSDMTHAPDVILLIRNPYRALLSYLNFMYSGGFHTRSIPHKLFKQGKHAITVESVQQPILAWTSVIRAVMNSTKRRLVMYYEDIVRDPIESSREMLKFPSSRVIQPIDLDERLACLSQDLTGMFKRPKAKFDFNPFSPEVSNELNKAIVEMRLLLKESGVEKEMPPYEMDEDYANVG